MQLQVHDDNYLEDINKQLDSTFRICEKLMKSKHYAKMGQEGIFAIMQKAKSLNMNPLDALNGSLYYVQGKVEMAGQTMGQLIRQAGHSFQKDPKSNDEICILHGKRADNGDKWTESFSIQEAKAAGLYKAGGAWSKYPRDMLMWRALSRLARQLFPDVIKGCYVQGEISDAPPLNEPVEEQKIQSLPVKLNEEQIEELNSMLHNRGNIREKVMEFIEREGGSSLEDMNPAYFDKVVKRISKLIDEEDQMARAKEFEMMSEEQIDESREEVEDATE